MSFSRTRGGDPLQLKLMIRLIKVFPAHAGVILFALRVHRPTLGFSRTRGGDPY